MKRFIEDFHDEIFDIIIIGGGITGAAVAYEASSRGLKVALFEKGDFGGETSAATSKLIHGGLRYLNNLEIGLVRESLRERRILENIAPNFVHPLAFMIPNYCGIMNNKWIIKLGLTLYDILAFDKKWTWDKNKRIPSHSTISKKRVIELEPNVRTKSLTGASVYYDTQSIFPERLTLAFLKSAVEFDAKISNYSMITEFIYKNGKQILGVKVLDTINNIETTVKGKLTINCGGPWADIILNLAERGKSNNHIRRSEGIHLITKKMAVNNAVVLRTKEGRHFFIIPWRGHSLIGTTDKEYIGNPDNYRVTKKGIDDFIKEINSSFGKENLTYKDINFAYGGLRPILDDQTEGTYKSSRRYEIYDNSVEGYEGLITVEGGKYTTSRNLATNVLKLIERKLKRKLTNSTTHKTPLNGCNIGDISAFLDSIKEENKDFNEKTIEYLGKNYGTQYKEVLKIAKENKDWTVPLNDDGEILAEVIFSIRYEMAMKLTDIFLRRTGIGTLGFPGNDVFDKIVNIASRELKLSHSRLQNEIDEVKTKMNLP